MAKAKEPTEAAVDTQATEIKEAAAAEAEAEAAAAAEAEAEAAAKAAAEEGVTKYVTTEKIRVNGGTMRDPKTNITYTRGIPTYGDAYKGSWLEMQIQAGFIKRHGG